MGRLAPRARPGARAVVSARGPRLTFFAGKGGVGKTTCAAAAAVRAATDGARVLLVSTDPAHSLGDALGVALGREPRRVSAVDGELYAVELDADRALTRWLREHEEAIRVIADRGTYLDEEDIDGFLSLSFPGVDELVGLVELNRLALARPYDEVVVDTAPTGHTLRLLQMPETLARVAQVLDDMHAKHRFLAASIGGRWRPDFADDTIVDIEREAGTLRELLRDRSRASFTWVTLPEELAVHESASGVRGVERLGAHVAVVVLNRVWPEPKGACDLCSPRVAAEDVWRRHVARTFATRTVLEVPMLVREPRGAAALLEMAGAVRRAKAPFTYAEPGPDTGAPRRPSRQRARRAPRRGVVETALPIAPSVRLAFFGGKGGVGKTTAAAASAIAVATARPTHRILLLSTDPAHSLGDAVGEPLGDEARPLAHGPPNLDVRELDAAGAWEAERERYRAGLDELFASVFSGRMDATFDRAVLEDLIDLAPPGIDELMAIVTLLDAVVGADTTVQGAKRKDVRAVYDLVVVDTAPTGHTLRLLALPPRALEWAHALMRVMLKYRSVMGLGGFASDLTRFARRLRVLMDWLKNPARCAFVIVTRPSMLPRLETERLVHGLRRLEVPISAVVANNVTAPSCDRCSSAAASEQPELERLGRLAAREAALDHLVVAPAVFPAPRGTLRLQDWHRAWSGWSGRST